LLSIPEELLELLVREISICHGAGVVQQHTRETDKLLIVALEFPFFTFSKK
jgi:hypothetical protein